MKRNISNRYRWLKYLTAVFLQFLFFISYSQDSNPERFRVDLSQPIFLTGETIWYKINNTNYKDYDDHSKILYINIHDKTGILLQQQKLELTEGKVHGSFNIPLTWEEDLYFLTCFTKWNLQFGSDGLTAIKIPIFNAFEEKEIHDSDTSTVIISESNRNSGIKSLSIELDEESYSRRQEVQVSIKSDHGLKDNLSITVHALRNLIDNPPNNFLQLKYEIEPQSQKEIFLEIEGLAIDPNTGSPISSDVFSLYKAGSNQFYKTSSKNGEIQIKVDDITNKATFQLFNMNPFQSTIPKFTLTTNGNQLLGIDSENQELQRNNEIKKYLRNIKLNQKVIEIFNNRKTDSLQSKTFKAIPFNADKVYDIKKYQQLKTFEEFLKEIVIYTELQKEEDKTTVRLKNTETRRFFMEKPWYLVDGYLTRNEEAILKIPFSNLVRVEIFNTNKSILGQLETIMIRSGLIAIYTNNNYLKNSIEKEPNIFEFEGIKKAQEYSQNHNFSKPSSSQSPEFDYHLYWNPNVSSNQAINFFTSDLIGEYTICVEGIDENGQSLSATKKFTVNY